MKKTLFGFEPDNDWEQEWKNMPQYKNIPLGNPKLIAIFKFENEKDFKKFKKLVKKYIFKGKKPFDGMQRKSVKQTWFPHQTKGSNYVYK